MRAVLVVIGISVIATGAAANPPPGYFTEQLAVVQFATWAATCGYRTQDWADLLIEDAIDQVEIRATQQWPSPSIGNPSDPARALIGDFGNDVSRIQMAGPRPNITQCHRLKTSGELAALDRETAVIDARRAAFQN